MKYDAVINLDAPGPRISKHIYGHFAEHLGTCIYGGFYIGPESPIPNRNGYRLDVIEALKKLNIPNLRWPGGCFADEYHWRDGIGSKQSRPRMINTHWGGVVENNHFGTHELMELCELLECEPYITGNLGSGSVQEMSQWVEYLTFDGRSPMTELRAANGRDRPWKLKYWGIGNENWGCGGNMTADFYADQVKRYATYCRDYHENVLYKIACGPNGDDYHWMETLMRSLVHCSSGCPEDRYIKGISLHHYTVQGTWGNKGSALDGDADSWYALMERAWFSDEILRCHKSIMDTYDPHRKIGLIFDEWGTWHDVEPGTNPGFLYQQNTIRDALVASLHFDIFHNHADRLHMANIAQTVNVLQAMILTRDEKMLLTPTYHVFEMNKAHQDSQALPIFTDLSHCTVEVKGKQVPTFSMSASRSGDSAGYTVSLTNLDVDQGKEICMDLRGDEVAAAAGRILTAPALNSHNTFDEPSNVAPQGFDAFSLKGSELKVAVPAHSFVVLRITT